MNSESAETPLQALVPLINSGSLAGNSRPPTEHYLGVSLLVFSSSSLCEHLPPSAFYSLPVGTLRTFLFDAVWACWGIHCGVYDVQETKVGVCVCL